MTLAARVGAAVHAALSEDRVVGAVVGVMHRGECVLLEAYGSADREAGRPMATDAIFLLASATKPIATTAILALAEQGILDLDLPVSTWLPAFRPRYGDSAPAITLRNLLRHTSGLSYPFREPADGPYHRLGVASGLDSPGLSGEEQLRRLGQAPLLFAPGTAWNYSLGVDVAGLAASAAAGQSLDEIVAARVTGPLGMRDTAFAVHDRARLVAHYGVDAAGRSLRIEDGYEAASLTGTPARFVPSRILDPKSYPSGGGGMAGTAADLLALVEALRRGGDPILGPDAARSMTTDALPAGLGDILEPGWSYGIGTQVLVAPGRAIGPERPGAFKGSGGYGHTWFADPALKLAAVALTNSTPEGVRGRFVGDVRAAIYDSLS